jgi:hypothetical protein
MRWGHAIESCGSEWFQSALTATISTTSTWNHSNFAVRDPVPELAMLDGPCATFSHMFLGTKVDGHIRLSFIISVYVTSHGFIPPMCGPRAAMLVPPAPKYQPAKNHYQSNPNIGSHHFNTIP